MQKLTITTKSKKEVIDLTRILNDLTSKNGFLNGILFLFASHTTCAITTADLDPGTDLDYIDAFSQMVPKLNYRHPHDPSHVPDHVMSSIIGTSLVIPVQSANMVLGQNQRVVLIEFYGPRERHLNLAFLPEKLE